MPIGHKLFNQQIGEYLVEGLQGILEETEVVEVMVITVDILRKIHFLSATCITQYFQVSEKLAVKTTS